MLSTVEKVLALKRISLFEHIPGEDLARIARIAEEIDFEPDETFIVEGDMGDSLYIILEGEILIHNSEGTLNKKIKADENWTSKFQNGNDSSQGADNIVGEMAILDSQPRSASVTAITHVKALKIEREDFYDILSERNEIAIGIIRILTRRLRQMNEKRSK